MVAISRLDVRGCLWLSIEPHNEERTAVWERQGNTADHLTPPPRVSECVRILAINIHTCDEGTAVCGLSSRDPTARQRSGDQVADRAHHNTRSLPMPTVRIKSEAGVFGSVRVSSQAASLCFVLCVVRWLLPC